MAMTLEDMLALLPDNEVGGISAQDMQTIVTGLMENITVNADALVQVQTDLDQVRANVDFLYNTRLPQMDTNFTALYNDVQLIEARVTALEGGPS